MSTLKRGSRWYEGGRAGKLFSSTAVAIRSNRILLQVQITRLLLLLYTLFGSVVHYE